MNAREPAKMTEPSASQGRADHEAPGERLVFVGGAPRSGTTLMQNMLDSHPDIFGGPELIHLEALMRLRRQFLTTDRYGWSREFYSAQSADRLFSNMIIELLIPLADRQKARMISEKTPVNVLVFQDLLELFPRARCIHVVRDPRAVVASMLRAGQRARGTETERTAPRDAAVRAFTTDIVEAILYVQRCYRAGFAAAQSMPDRCLTVHYEALVGDPRAETQRICDFLELPWSADMLSPAEKHHAGEAQMTKGFENLFYSPSTFRRNPDASHVDKWKTDLTPLQKALIVTSFDGFEHHDKLPPALRSEVVSTPARAMARGYRLLLGVKRRLRLAAIGRTS